MTKDEAFELVSTGLEIAGIYPAPTGKPWPASAYFGRSLPDTVQVRVSDHPSRYPRNMCVQIVLTEGLTEEQVKEMTSEAIEEFTALEDKIWNEMNTS